MKEIIECPICKKHYKLFFAHIVKSADIGHQNFLKKINEKIINYIDDDLTSKEVSNILNISQYYILNIWEKSEKFEEKKLKIKKRANIKSGRTRKNLFRKNKEVIGKIITYFNTTLSLVRIAKLFDCDDRTVRRIFEKTFGINETKERSIKVGRAYRSMPSKKQIKDSIRLAISKEFFNKVSLKEVAEKFNVFPVSVGRIWIEFFGKEQYDKRKRNIAIPLQKIRCEQNNTKLIGSKNELLCYSLLKERLNTEVKHHDYNLCPPYEIDIIIPEFKIAINWDGIYHRKQIFKNSLKVIQQRDSFKNKVLLAKGWKHISVEDDGSHNPEFVEQKVREIINLIEKGWEGKIAI